MAFNTTDGRRFADELCDGRVTQHRARVALRQACDEIDALRQLRATDQGAYEHVVGMYEAAAEDRDAARATIGQLEATLAELRATNAVQAERMACTFQPVELTPTIGALDDERQLRAAAVAAEDKARP